VDVTQHGSGLPRLPRRHQLRRRLRAANCRERTERASAGLVSKGSLWHRSAIVAVAASWPMAVTLGTNIDASHLDMPGDHGWLRGSTVPFRRNHRWDQLRNRGTGRRTRIVAIRLAPTEYLIGVYVVSPGHPRDRRAWRIRCRYNLPLHRLRPRAVTSPPLRVVSITGFVDASRPHNTRYPRHPR